MMAQLPNVGTRYKTCSLVSDLPIIIKVNF